VDKLFFGKAFGEVHRLIDMPVLWLGRKHRVLFHDYHEAFVLGALASTDYRSASAGYLHVWVDKLCSEDKYFKKWLEFSARQDALWEKEMRRFEKRLKKQCR
jgi:hypothetical protein